MHIDRLIPLHGFPLRGVLLLMLVSCGAPDTPRTDLSTLSTWTVHSRGFGPLLAGMRVEEAMTAVPGSLSVPAGAVPEACTYAVWDSAPPGVRVMVEDGAVTRVDVTEGRAVATAAGVRIGDAESRIDSLYAGRVERRPHKYTDGRYLVVREHPDSTKRHLVVRERADSASVPQTATEPGAAPPNSRRDFRLVFETDGARVTRFRAGLFPSVEYVEGCA